MSLVLKTVKLLLIKRSVELKSSSLAIVCVHFWTKSCCMVNSFVFLLQQIDYQKNQTSEKNQEQIFDTYKKIIFCLNAEEIFTCWKRFFPFLLHVIERGNQGVDEISVVGDRLIKSSIKSKKDAQYR